MQESAGPADGEGSTNSIHPSAVKIPARGNATTLGVCHHPVWFQEGTKGDANFF